MSQPEPGACGDSGCYVLHADPSHPIHPPDYEPDAAGSKAALTPTSAGSAGQDHISNSAACNFAPSKPPWPSQMCARCGEWRDNHAEVMADPPTAEEATI